MIYKYLLFFSLIIVSVLFVSTATASVFISSGNTISLSSGASISIPSVSPYPLIGMNYGSKDVFQSVGSFSTSSVQSDIDSMYSDGFRYIRVGMPDYTNEVQWQHVITVADIAQTKGMHVLCGVSSNPTIISTTTEAAWMAGVVARAASAQGHCDSFAIGNEEEYHNSCPNGWGGTCGGSLTDLQIRDDLRAIATSIKTAAIFTGELVYSAPQGETQLYEWVNEANRGDIDRVCFNNYGNRISVSQQMDLANFKKYIQLEVGAFGGEHTCTTEFNAVTIWSSMTLTNSGLSDAIASRLQILRDLSYQPVSYYYTYTTVGDDFAAKYQAGGYRQLYYILKQYVNH